MERRNSEPPEPSDGTPTAPVTTADEENEVTMSITFILQEQPQQSSRRRPQSTAYTRGSLRPLPHRRNQPAAPSGQTQTHAVSLSLPAGPAVLASLANLGHLGGGGTTGMTSIPADLFSSIGGRQQSLESIAGRLAPLLLLVRFAIAQCVFPLSPESPSSTLTYINTLSCRTSFLEEGNTISRDSQEPLRPRWHPFRFFTLSRRNAAQSIGSVPFVRRIFLPRLSLVLQGKEGMHLL